MSQPVTKVFKKGEVLFKEGDKLTSILLIQSGSVSVCLLRPKKNIELFTLGANQVLGEHATLGATTHVFSATAVAETKVLEIPVEALKQSMESLPQLMKIFFRSLIEKSKSGLNEVKSNRLEKDSSPCPDDQVSKVFGCLYHTVKTKGQKDEKNPNQYVVEWGLTKQYAQRIFLESPKRLEQSVSLLSKLKLAEFTMGRPPEDPEGPEQIMKVTFPDISPIEAFFEFYQYYYFKGGKSDILKVDDFCRNFIETLLGFTKDYPVDRFGVVSVELTKFIEHCKSTLNLNVNSDHFARLEQKGIFLKRKPLTDGQVVLQFELKELKNQLFIWKIIREIDKWNEKGFVDLNDDDAKKVAKKDGMACPSCQHELQAASKFCPECGFKLAA